MTADDGTSLVLDHYHFKGWPDLSVPVGENRKQFAYLVELVVDHIMEH